MIEVGQRHAATLPTVPGQGYGADPMEGYDETTYGDAFADVYDDWYRDISDIEATVADLLDLAVTGRVIELGVGTGRLALPLAEAGRHRGVSVTGVDTSRAMLDQLTARDRDGLVEVIRADMVDGLPAGPFSMAFAAYNTIFNLTADGAQEACFRAVVQRLAPGGRFVIEAFVPDDPPRHGDHVSVRTLAADRVVLSVTVHDAGRRTADGQFVELSESGGVRLRPWSIRYHTPAGLDRMAIDAGFELEHRWESFGRVAFVPDSTRHVSVYRKT